VSRLLQHADVSEETCLAGDVEHFEGIVVSVKELKSNRSMSLGASVLPDPWTL
jgi:hypothetical protein